MAATNPYQTPRSRVETIEEGYGEIKLFSAAGRMGRMRYVAYGVGIMILIYLVFGALAGLFSLVGNRGGAMTWIAGAIIIIGTIIVLVVSLLWAIQRLHDFNQRGWWILLPSVPGIVAAITVGSTFFNQGLQQGARTIEQLSGPAQTVNNVVGIINFILYAILLFTPGTRGPNRFGNPPPPNSTGVKIAFWLIVALIPLAIIAAIVIPMYYGQGLR